MGEKRTLVHPSAGPVRRTHCSASASTVRLRRAVLDPPPIADHRFRPQFRRWMPRSASHVGGRVRLVRPVVSGVARERSAALRDTREHLALNSPEVVVGLDGGCAVPGWQRQPASASRRVADTFRIRIANASRYEIRSGRPTYFEGWASHRPGGLARLPAIETAGAAWNPVQPQCVGFGRMDRRARLASVPSKASPSLRRSRLTRACTSLGFGCSSSGQRHARRRKQSYVSTPPERCTA